MSNLLNAALLSHRNPLDSFRRRCILGCTGKTHWRESYLGPHQPVHAWADDAARSLVTGSTGGIGEGIARRPATDGFAIVASGHRIAKGEGIARQITDQGGTTCFLAADIADPDACRSVIEAAVELKMEILVK